MSGRAVFLDRDGVLNAVILRDGKAASPRSLQELSLTPGAAHDLSTLARAGYQLFVVSNQPDIARGLMSPQALAEINHAIGVALPVEAIAVCPHDNADRCDCRKPAPGLLLKLAEAHGIELAKSWMVGDQDRDIACGHAAGCRTVLLDRSYNSGVAAGPTFLAESLSQAVDQILAASGATPHPRIS